MPSWRLHEKWARKMGINQHIARAINIFVDAGEIHDWERNKLHGYKMGALKAYQLYGEEGLRAYHLHQALDYIKERISGFSRQSIFGEISKNLAGIPRVKRKVLMKVMLKRAYRDMPKNKPFRLNQSVIDQIRRDFIRWAVYRDLPEGIINFVLYHFGEIIRDILLEIKGSNI